MDKRKPDNVADEPLPKRKKVDSVTMDKRKPDNIADEPLPKRKKVESDHKILVGTSQNLSSRENQLFDTILNLVTKTKENYPNCTTSSSLFSNAGNAIFMEYSSKEENLYLWLKWFAGPEVKFLVHPVYMTESVPAANKPLLAFSKNFVDSENWRIIKSSITQIFGGVSQYEDEHYDFVFAFSRQGNFVHFRSYKILNVPGTTLEKSLNLSPSCHHICFMPVDLPIIGTSVKTSQAHDLSEVGVNIGSPLSNFGQLHSAELNRSVIHFVLEDVVDLSSWRGFGTCLTDFKERNRPMFKGKVLGSDNAMIDYANDRYKAVIRSLLFEAVGLHKSDWCFSDIAESDVCLSGTTVKLSWKIELKKYGIIGARRNYKSIRALILGMFKDVDLPRDLEILLQLLNADNLTPGDYLCTHSSLMEDLGKSHLINDIFLEFTENLLHRHKMLMAEPFGQRYITELEARIKSNEYLASVHANMYLGQNAGRMVTSGIVKLEVDAEVSVLCVQKGEPRTAHDKMTALTKLIILIRNSNAHLHNHLKKKNEKKKIQFLARASMRILTHVAPDLLPMLQNELRCIVGDKWFSKYFHHRL